MVSLLSCSINGVDISLDPVAGTLLHRMYGQDSVTEHTTCNYGLDETRRSIFDAHGMVIAGTDEYHEVRAVERTDHPYFVATLFQPQLRSAAGAPHPIFLGLVRATLGLSPLP